MHAYVRILAGVSPHSLLSALAFSGIYAFGAGTVALLKQNAESAGAQLMLL